MSEADDAVREARAQNLRLAASRAARKEALSVEVAALERQRGEAAELAAAGGDEVRSEAESLLRDLDGRLQAKRAELDEAERDLGAVQAELRELGRLKQQAARTEVDTLTASVVGGDPLIRSAEEIALDNARGHIADTDAQARLGDELAGVAGEAEAPAAAPQPARKMSDEEAKQLFEELRAKRGKGGGPQSE